MFGKTINFARRFKTHEHLTEDVKTIEYIECESEAEQAWKEIYYINLYYNDLSMNVADVYTDGIIKDFEFKDIWKKYNIKDLIEEKITDEMIENNYQKYVIDVPKYNYKELIHILDNYKLNEIGAKKHDLSSHWFRRTSESNVMQLKNNTLNYFCNIIKAGSSKNMWTSNIENKDVLTGKGYAKGYVNGYYNKKCKEKTSLAFLKNIFYPDNLSHTQEEQDKYALSELNKFIFHSALSNGEPINIYIPSSRMRNLLINWINEQKYDETN